MVILLCISIWFLSRIFGREGFKFFGLVKCLLLFLFVLGVVLIFAWQSEVVINRLFGGDGVSTRELGGRAIIWASYLKLLSQNVFLGFGVSGFELKAFEIFGVAKNPHNALLEIMLYTGLVGVFIYLIFLSNIVIAVYRLWVDAKLVLPLLLFVVFSGFFFSIQALGEKFCWFVLAYIVGTRLWSPKARQYFGHGKKNDNKSVFVFRQRAE